MVDMNTFHASRSHVERHTFGLFKTGKKLFPSNNRKFSPSSGEGTSLPSRARPKVKHGICHTDYCSVLLDNACTILYMLSFFSQEYDTEFIYHLFKSSIPI